MTEQENERQRITKTYCLSPVAIAQIELMASRQVRNLSNFLTVYFEDLAEKEGKK